jgi:hypothetical protein
MVCRARLSLVAAITDAASAKRYLDEDGRDLAEQPADPVLARRPICH